MRENGALERIEKLIEPPPQECPDYTGDPLGILNVVGAFYLLAIGFGAGICIFIGEYILRQMIPKSDVIEVEALRNQPMQVAEAPKTQQMIVEEAFH